MAALNMYNPMASRGYSMPPALSGYDLTPAQIHARNNEPAVNMHYDQYENLVPAGTDSINANQGNILSDNTDETGAYLGSLTTSREEAAAEFHRRKMLVPSAEMHGNAMLAASPAVLSGDPDTFETLVDRYLQEQVAAGEKRNVDAAVAKANKRMEMSASDSLQTNLTEAGSDVLQFLGGIREGGILSAGKDEDGAFARLVDQAETRRDNTSTDLTPLGRYLFPDAGGPAVPVNEQQQQNGPYFPEMPVAPPALTDTTAPVTAGNNNGALTATGSQNTQPAANRVRASTGGYTGNARGSGLPDMQIGLGERLMRMGMAGLSAGAQGPLAQMGAMTGAYNDVNQANRDAEMGTFKIEEARRQAHAARVAKLAAAKANGAGDLSKIKDHQGKSFGFYNRGVDAERVLSRLDEQGTEFWKTVGSKVPIFGNKFVGSEYRQYDQARRNFLNAVLRRESGAVISEKEFEEGNQQYFPQFGDEETEIAQKRENRRTTMLGIRISAGDAMQYTSNYPSSGTVKVGTATVTLLP